MTSTELPRKKVGNTNLTIPPVCFGTSSLGDMPGTYGYSVDESRAAATLQAIMEGPARFLDASRNYGMGRSEERIGQAIRENGGLPEGVVISTKLDRDMDSLKFDADRARRSLEESLTALSIDRVDILHLHDPEYASSLDDVTRRGGAVDELFKMKEEGLTTAVGLAAGRVDVMMPILRNYDFDVLITHNRHTLLNANAEEMLNLAKEKGISVMNAAPYAGGALAKGAANVQQYVYQEATDEMLAPVKAVEEICARHGIPPGAAALQFSIRDPRIASTICGVTKPERVEQTLAWARFPISDEAWQELLALPRSSDDPEANRVYSSD